MNVDFNMKTAVNHNDEFSCWFFQMGGKTLQKVWTHQMSRIKVFMVVRKEITLKFHNNFPLDVKIFQIKKEFFFRLFRAIQLTQIQKRKTDQNFF